MLREHDNVQQHLGEGRRRWFSDPDFDLIVWYGERGQLGTVVGFQLCYDKRSVEHAVTWRRVGGLTHARIDDGDHYVGATPILVPDGPLPDGRLRDRFIEAAGELEPSLLRLVTEVLRLLPWPAVAWH
jgi:hypothetical protein